MIPITGPLEKSEGNSGPFPGSYVRYRKWYRQKRPYNLPLPFISEGFKTVSGNNLEDWYGSPGWSYNPYWMYAGFKGISGLSPLDSLVEDVASAARENFNSKLRAKAEIGAALAEARSSIDMIAKRTGQIVRFARALRRRDFVGAGHALGMVVYKKKKSYYAKGERKNHQLNVRKGSRDFSSNFLEYWFGWAPLIADIGAAADILSDPFIGADLITAKAKDSGVYTNRVNTFYPWAPVYDSATHNYEAIVKCQAWVTVSNPNLSLAAQMGLTNPLSVAWEIVPFSFVIDYFANIGAYIESYDSLFGVNLAHTSMTVFKKDKCTANQSWWDNRMSRNCVSEYYRVDRSNNLPEVKLRLKQFNLSLGRAASSIALLIQLGIKR